MLSSLLIMQPSQIFGTSFVSTVQQSQMYSAGAVAKNRTNTGRTHQRINAQVVIYVSFNQ